MGIESRERRCKVLYVPERLVLGIIVHAASMWEALRDMRFVQLPVLSGLPDGVIIERVSNDQRRMAFAFCLYHESWPIVPDGDLTPDFEGETGIEWTVIDLESRRPPMETAQDEPTHGNRRELL